LNRKVTGITTTPTQCSDVFWHCGAQLIFECKEVLTAAVTVKQYYVHLVGSVADATGGHVIDIETYEDDLQNMLEVKLLLTRLLLLTYILWSLWRRSSVLKTSVFGWWTFPDLYALSMVDRWPLSVMSQPTRPPQPSIPLGSVSNYMNYGVRDIKRQTRAVYGCLVTGQSPLVQTRTAAYRL